MGTLPTIIVNYKKKYISMKKRQKQIISHKNFIRAITKWDMETKNHYLNAFCHLVIYQIKSKAAIKYIEI